MNKPGSNVDQWLQALDCSQQLAVQEQEMRALLLSMLEVLDSLDRCIAAPDQSLDSQTCSSLPVIRKQFIRALEGAGVVFMQCPGQPFDPLRHEALETRQVPEIAPGTIVEEVVRGCAWRDRLLRRAKVVVATKA